MKTLGQRCDQSNKQASDAESKAFEVKKLLASAKNELQIFKATLNQINSYMSSTEAGANPAISKVQMAVQYIITVNIEEAKLYHFGKELQNQLAPALEVISVNIQQIYLNQVRTLGSIKPIMTR